MQVSKSSTEPGVQLPISGALDQGILFRSSPPDMDPPEVTYYYLPRPSVCLGRYAPNGRETLDHRVLPGSDLRI